MRLRTFGGLWILDESGLAISGLRPRPLALLAILAAAGDKGLTRDQVLGILWPESDPERARHGLSQAVYNLRRELGLESVLGTPDQRLVSTVPSDVQELRVAIAVRNWDDVATLYNGPFLDGFYLNEAPEFERWLDAERLSWGTAATRALENAANALSTAGRHDEASQLWLRLARIDPVSARYAVAVMESFAAAGDRAAALTHGHSHIAYVRREFEADAESAVQQMVAQLRAIPTVSAPTRHSTTVAAADAASNVASNAVSSVAPDAASNAMPNPVSTAASNAAVSHEPSVEPEASRTTASRITALDTTALRTTALHTTELRAESAVTVRHSVFSKRKWNRAPLAVASIAAVLLLGWRAMTALEAGSEKQNDRDGKRGDSLVARRLYDEGLRSLYQFDGKSAGRRFRAALREDPHSAITAYRTWQAAVMVADTDATTLADRALSLVAHAAPRDSLLIVTHLRAARNDVGALSAARALAARFPNDPEALVRAGEALSLATVDLAPLVQLLERAIALDSAAHTDDGLAPCRACEALSMLAVRYEVADSLDAAERVVRRWSKMRPTDPGPWSLLSGIQNMRGQPSRALESQRHYKTLGGPTGGAIEALVQNLYLDNFDAANAQCETGLTIRDATTHGNFRWYCAIALRMQGRYQATLTLVYGGRQSGSSLTAASSPLEARLAAILDVETGRPLRAAARFRDLANVDNKSTAPVGIRARGESWNLTLAATAAVAGGDTSMAHALVDSIESIGQRGLYVRDPLLHHFVRGLLHARGGRHEVAVREFRAALHAPARGYTRINYELGRSLLVLNRASEAISVVRAALHGGIEGPQLYVTRTELHELLAQSFDAEAQRDSAVVHYAIVERAWRASDTSLRSRWAIAKKYISSSQPH